MKKIIGIVAVLFMLSCSCFAYEFPIIHTKSAGDFYHFSKVVEGNAEYDRIINFDNVSVIRNVGKAELEIDKTINLNFGTSEERSTFIKEYNNYMSEKAKVILNMYGELTSVKEFLDVFLSVVICSVLYYVISRSRGYKK